MVGCRHTLVVMLPESIDGATAERRASNIPPVDVSRPIGYSRCHARTKEYLRCRSKSRTLRHARRYIPSLSNHTRCITSPTYVYFASCLAVVCMVLRVLPSPPLSLSLSPPCVRPPPPLSVSVSLSLPFYLSLSRLSLSIFLSRSLSITFLSSTRRNLTHLSSPPPCPAGCCRDSAALERPQQPISGGPARTSTAGETSSPFPFIVSVYVIAGVGGAVCDC